MFEEFLFDLKIARKKSGLTQADCGHLMGVSSNIISQIELGERTPTAREMCALSVIYGASFESFYSENMQVVRSVLSENIESIPEAPEGWLATESRTRSLEYLSGYLEADLPEII